MKKWLRIQKQMVATFMLLLFAVYYVDVNCFVHSHIINGVTIVHSHIHRGSHHDTDTGGHTSTQINLIAGVHSQFLTTENAQASAPLLFLQLVATLGSEQQAKIESQHLCCASLRAPPYCA